MLSGIHSGGEGAISAVRTAVCEYVDATLLQRRHKDQKRFAFFSMHVPEASLSKITGILLKTSTK